MLTLITPTGARPLAFALCEKMMARQDYAGAVRWIIVDDGPTPTPMSPKVRRGWSRHVLRPRPLWKRGDNTQARNLGVALDEAERLAGAGEDLCVVFIEDDDWYAPQWLSEIARQIENADMVGESHARYYNVAMRRGSYLNNEFHASLRASALRRPGVAALRRAMERFSKTYDFIMWRDPSPTKRLFKTDLTVGMKALPGRAGIAAGHDDMGGFADPELKLLREWIGADADLYAGFYDEEAMTKDRVQVYATGRLKRYENRMLTAGDKFEIKRKELRAFVALKFVTREGPSPEVEPPPPPEPDAEKPKKQPARVSKKARAKPADTTPPIETAATADDQVTE